MKSFRQRTRGKILAAALAAVVLLCLGAPAFADNQNPLPTATITAEKIFNVDAPVNIDQLTSVTFTLSRHAYTNGPAGSAVTNANMPMPAADAVTIAAADFTAAAGNLSKSGSKAFAAISYATAGIYTYKLVETVTSRINGVTYDEVERFVNVYVENITDANGNLTLNDDGTPYVKVTAITVWKEQNFTDIPGGGGDVNTNTNKIGMGTVTGNNGTATVTFTNTFGNTQETRLEIKKVVKGAAGDTTKDFTFTLATNNNATTHPLAYQVFNAANVPQTGADKVGAIAAGGTFKLKHGEYVRIYGLTDGATYTITESDKAGYATGISGTSQDTAISVAEGEAVTSAGEKTYKLDKVDSQTFTNTKGSTPPTGIVLDILPFVLMALLAGVGIVALLIKRRGR